MLDFAKAFDRVKWPALDMILHHFGFGPTFRTWINTFYSGTLVYLLFNSKPLLPFELGSGVRQGDPLSPGLFVLFIEPLLQYLRHHLGKYGLSTGDTHHLMIAFADDCTATLADLSHTPTFLSRVGKFCFATGMKLNLSKTMVMPFHHLSSSFRTRIETTGVNIVSSHCKLLGIFFGPTMSDQQRMQHLFHTFISRCTLWRYRARTLRGKVVILRSVILPLLWYTCAVTCITPAALHPFEQCILNFLNNAAGRDPSLPAAKGSLAKTWHHARISHGGLGLPDLLHFTKALQLNTLVTGLKQIRRQPTIIPLWLQPALIIFDQYLAPFSATGLDILCYPSHLSNNNYGSGPLGSHLGSFLHQIHSTWNGLTPISISSCFSSMDILFMPLWKNKFLSLRGRSLFDASV